MIVASAGAASRFAQRIVALAAAFAVIACAVAPPVMQPAGSATLPDVAFDIAGRLSARHGRDAAAASFRWAHRPDADELTLATPMGAALAQLEGHAGDVRLTLADGRVASASDWEALTARVLGAPIPVRGLAWWIRGSAHPGSASSVERDANGRATVLRQDGWEIVYAYPGGDNRRPARVTLAYPDTEVRIVVDDWGAASP